MLKLLRNSKAGWMFHNFSQHCWLLLTAGTIQSKHKPGGHLSTLTNYKATDGKKTGHIGMSR